MKKLNYPISKTLGATAIVLLISLSAFADLNDFDGIMVRSTYKIQCGNSLGTCFILGAPRPDNPSNFVPVLVTAKHVLAAFTDPKATLYLRPTSGDTYLKKAFDVQLSVNGTNLWVGHPTADVAVLQLTSPDPILMSELNQHSIPGFTYLATDQTIKDFKIHPGDEVRVLGYPLGQESSAAGFPVLRSGRIASYPLVPSSIIQTYLLDFRVFNGNSGGPVYMCERRYMIEGSLESVNFCEIMGLISQESLVTETTSGLEEDYVHRYNLGIGVMVPAQKIKEAIDLLKIQ